MWASARSTSRVANRISRSDSRDRLLPNLFVANSARLASHFTPRNVIWRNWVSRNEAMDWAATTSSPSRAHQPPRARFSWASHWKVHASRSAAIIRSSSSRPPPARQASPSLLAFSATPPLTWSASGPMNPPHVELHGWSYTKICAALLGSGSFRRRRAKRSAANAKLWSRAVGAIKPFDTPPRESNQPTQECRTAKRAYGIDVVTCRSLAPNRTSAKPRCSTVIWGKADKRTCSWSAAENPSRAPSNHHTI
jgi:hypothetical protein